MRTDIRMRDRLKGTPFPVIVMLLSRKMSIMLSRSFWSLYFRLAFKVYKCSVGPGLVVDGRMRLYLRENGSVEIGRNVTLISKFDSNLVGLTNPVVLDCQRTGKISIGDNSGCSATIISSQSSITIGDHVKIGGNVRIFDHDYHSSNYQYRRDQRDKLNVKTKPIFIGDDVFIGTNAIITKGVSIGDRSVIGAGSVVTKSVPPDEVWAGNPARRIK